jgi:hypothetical protein
MLFALQERRWNDAYGILLQHYSFSPALIKGVPREARVECGKDAYSGVQIILNNGGAPYCNGYNVGVRICFRWFLYKSRAPFATQRAWAFIAGQNCRDSYS